MLDGVKGRHDRNPPVPDTGRLRQSHNHATIAAAQVGSDNVLGGAVHEVPIIHQTPVLQVEAIDRLAPARVRASELTYQDEQREQTGFVPLQSQQRRHFGKGQLRMIACQSPERWHFDAQEAVTGSIVPGAGLEEALQGGCPRAMCESPELTLNRGDPWRHSPLVSGKSLSILKA
jgi:hypothetical protein